MMTTHSELSPHDLTHPTGRDIRDCKPFVDYSNHVCAVRTVHSEKGIELYVVNWLPNSEPMLIAEKAVNTLDWYWYKTGGFNTYLDRIMSGIRLEPLQVITWQMMRVTAKGGFGAAVLLDHPADLEAW